MNNRELKRVLNEVIFGTDTPAGKLFDVILIIFILLSVFLLMLESIEALAEPYQYILRIGEWLFTAIFTLEYLVRLYCTSRPLRYATSFYGIIDLLSVLPSYLSLLFPGANFLVIVRLLRVLRVFRVLKLVRYLSEANVLLRSLMMARRKIVIFFFSVLVLSIIFGSLMYVVEGRNAGFSSIPKSVYWTIVTITTVGYGDITPQSPMGQFIAALAMLTGYSIIAVPTGILTAELSQEIQRERGRRKCIRCKHGVHEAEAYFCNRCGEMLPLDDAGNHSIFNG